MATPRKRWFKVADSVLREDWTRDQRSTFLGLLAWFNQRRQRDGCKGRSACEAPIPPGDLLTITLTDTLDDARELLRDVSSELHLTIESRGRFTFVRWPKLADFQDWECPDAARRAPGQRPTRARRVPDACPEDAPSVSVSDSDSVTVSEEEEQTPSESGVEAPPRGKSRWVNLLRNVPGFDPAEADERAAWVETFEGEIESRAASELPADATKKQVNERARSILLARWRTYVTKGPRIFAGIAHRLERDRIKAEWAAQHGEAHDRELAEVGSL